MVAHEAPLTAGFASEVASRIQVTYQYTKLVVCAEMPVMQSCIVQKTAMPPSVSV